MSVGTYAAKKMVTLINGLPLRGFSDSDMVTVALDEESFVKYMSVDGQGSRSANGNSAGTFTFSLAQTSASNQIFSEILKTDIKRSDGSVKCDVTIVDPNSNGTYYKSVTCWIKGMPESGFNKEISTREWVVDSTDIDWNIAGTQEYF